MAIRDTLEYMHKSKVIIKKKNFLKAKVQGIITKALQTAFIGALSAFEEEFGSLWGHGQKQLTSEQKENLKKWKIVRERILDLGNAQVRHSKHNINIFVTKFERVNQDEKY